MKRLAWLFAVLFLAGTLQAAVGGWYVVTYSGQPVAGPFSLLGDCTREAQHLARQYSNVSSVCKFLN